MSPVALLRRTGAGLPGGFTRRAVGLLCRRAADTLRQWRDARRSTYLTDLPAAGRLACFFTPPSVEALRAQAPLIRELTERFLKHQFDLLGSEWVTVGYGTVCAGLEGHRYPPGDLVDADREGRWLAGRVNPANLAEAQAAWQLIAEGYRPIDWQLDFKSGHRWSPTTPATAIRYGDRLGADVKVPWELARMQHLLQLVWAYVLAAHGEPGFLAPARYAAEIEYQVLDFIATNPPRYGVNWSCTMDVAIRVSNWLVACDLLKAAGWHFRPEFERRFVRSVYDHGRHIVSHLEWHPSVRANHYLADVVGLLFTAAFLPASEESNRWLEFAVRELVQEVGCQFTPDGANFEASTSYHRLSAEMVVFATALVLTLTDERAGALRSQRSAGLAFRPGPPAPALQWRHTTEWDRTTPFPAWYVARLRSMADFTAAVTRPDGRVVQFGDNDSGRFLKLTPAYTFDLATGVPCEDVLDHRHLSAAFLGLFRREETPAEAGNGAEEEIVRKLVWAGVQRDVRADSRLKKRPVQDTQAAAFRSPVGERSLTCDGRGVPEFRVFPDFGLYVYRTSRFVLWVRCGPVGQNGNGGHAHNDQLSFELAVDGIPVVIDPGTYLYTPVPSCRNQFRSTAMHNTLSMDHWEQNGWDSAARGLFALEDAGRIRVLTAEPDRFVGELERCGVRHRRTFHISPAGLQATDECSRAGEKRLSFHFAPGVTIGRSPSGAGLSVTWRDGQLRLTAEPGEWELVESAWSASYGRIESTAGAAFRSLGSTIAWRLECEERP